MNARGGEDPVGTGLETGADGGALTRGLHHRRLTFVHTAASALIGGPYVGETACLKAICEVGCETGAGYSVRRRLRGIVPAVWPTPETG